jgi:hydroxymethylglutaryl-CoA lyase
MAKHPVTLFEVGPRDGLQNELRIVSLKNKIWFVTRLIQAGVRELELGSFVHPKWVPQMADTEQIFKKIQLGTLKLKQTRAWSLVPNLKGLERARAVGAKHIAVFTAASETFSKKNTGMTLKKSLNEIKEMVKRAHHYNMLVRGYVSTAFSCPFEGKINPKKSLKLIDALLEVGVFQVSVGDTIGAATPRDVEAVIGPVLKNILIGSKNRAKIAVHFHDTRGIAVANALRALDLGVRVFDSSTGGLGGCPFAPGAKGNVATEHLVYLLHGMGLNTGINLTLLKQTSVEFLRRIKRSPDYYKG